MKTSTPPFRPSSGILSGRLGAAILPGGLWKPQNGDLGALEAPRGPRDGPVDENLDPSLGAFLGHPERPEATSGPGGIPRGHPETSRRRSAARASPMRCGVMCSATNA